MLTVETKRSRAGQSPTKLTKLTIVVISNGGRGFGLYRVKQMEARTMVLHHGAVSFPVGMNLDVEVFKPPEDSSPSSFRQRAMVAENGDDGMRLVW